MQENLYDITGIPHFPYVPGFYDWLYLLVGFVFALILVKYFAARRSQKKPLLSAFKVAKQEIKNLQRLSDSSTGKRLLFDASLISRRLLSAVEDKAADSRSAKELSEWASHCGRAELSCFLDILVRLDKLKFTREPGNLENKELLRELLVAIDGYEKAKNEVAK